MNLLLASLLALGSPVTAAAPEGTILPSANAVKGSYVVVLRDGASPATVAARHGGAVGRVFTSALNGFEVSLAEKAARRLAADPAVAYVQQNGTMKIDPEVLGTQPNPPSWGLDSIDQRRDCRRE